MHHLSFEFENQVLSRHRSRDITSILFLKKACFLPCNDTNVGDKEFQVYVLGIRLGLFYFAHGYFVQLHLILTHFMVSMFAGTPPAVRIGPISRAGAFRVCRS